jgi:hypothetical protein
MAHDVVVIHDRHQKQECADKSVTDPSPHQLSCRHNIFPADVMLRPGLPRAKKEQETRESSICVSSEHELPSKSFLDQLCLEPFLDTLHNLLRNCICHAARGAYQNSGVVSVFHGRSKYRLNVHSSSLHGCCPTRIQTVRIHTFVI